jgi:hypothetical protein
MQAKIKVKNGYWTYNGKPLAKCTFPERQIVAQFIRNSIFNIAIDAQMETRESDINLAEYNYEFDFVKP